MEYNKSITDMRPGDEVEGFYVLRSAAVRVANTGKPFLSGSLADIGGFIESVAWDYAGPVNGDDVGKVVKIRGRVGSYRRGPQLIIDRLRLAGERDSYDVGRLVKCAPIDREETMRELHELLESIDDADYRAVALLALERRGEVLQSIPAAKSFHHGFLGGLLMHTANMLRIADFLAGMYAETVDRGLLLTGTLLHDIAKYREFRFSELGLVAEYSNEGHLLGHIFMGALEASELCRELGVPEQKAVLLEHLVLSHHGEPDFGSAIVPMCAEAELLSLIDRIDSRMEIYSEELAKVKPNHFSERIYALDKKIFNHCEGNEKQQGAAP